ncbi:MAG: sulfite exporter TauE/SafE family protein [Gammaproteobacteria bacterium]|nr:sulfite exporter TauE/SafE family protein [Gammaproteobacteria bacterium]
MDPITLALLAALFIITAAVYSTVGHAGASGYLAIMALAGVAPAVMRPTALVLNVLVAVVGTWRFSRAGLVDWRALAPFAIASVPLAFLGGRVALPVPGYRTLVGVVLLASAAVLVWRSLRADEAAPEPPLAIPVPVALVTGAVLGFVAGLSGTGGGIFLSPLLLLLGWAGPRRTAGLAAPFILVNSASGLAGLASAAGNLPDGIAWLAAAVLAGGVVGTHLGTSRLPARLLLRALAVVLVIAGGKFLLPA